MKFSAVFLVVAVSVVCYSVEAGNATSEKNIETESADQLEKVVDDKSIWEIIKDDALKATKFTVKALEKEFHAAEKVFNKIVHNEVFIDCVKILIPLIDSDASIHGCQYVCTGAAKEIFKLEDVTDAMSACGLVCRGALAKLRDAAQKVVDKL